MCRCRIRPGLWLIVLMLGSVRLADAQERVTLAADLLFYGDNTEFRNPFREGETILGSAAGAALLLDVNARVQIRLGAFGNTRFGSERAFELARPVVALAIRGRRSTFEFGTLTTSRLQATGPDLHGPHGLVPPLQRETLVFERPYEAGLRWSFDGSRLRHDAWINWQRLNTPAHRERFDTGLSAQLRLNSWLSLPLQLHVVHEGGQLHAAGPVADSAAFGSGLSAARRIRRIGLTSLDFLALGSRHAPDRERPASSRSGRAMFARLAVVRNGWRAHAIVWRGDGFVKDEGDPNYLAVRRDGSSYRGIRDYAETGVARRFRLAPDVALEASARLHRTERHYEYSYRVTASASLRARLR